MPLVKQKEIFYKLVVERTKEIKKLWNHVNFENLIYYFKVSTKYIDLNGFVDDETLKLFLMI